jgi:nucleoside-diphosphate-sugar epimerase
MRARVLVTGAGGFIGHHLVTHLKAKGNHVRGVDVKHPEFAPSDADDFRVLDLRRWEDCLEATEGIDEVYADLRRRLGDVDLRYVERYGKGRAGSFCTATFG